MNQFEVRESVKDLTLSIFGTDFVILVKQDQKYGSRTYLQIVYNAPCTKTDDYCHWRGRKWYLSSHMTRDEVVKTAFAAFKAAVEHEVMEGFKWKGVTVFNPHINFEELVNISHKEIKREAI